MDAYHVLAVFLTIGLRAGSRRQVATFGERLKQVREKKGVSLEEISFATKIGTRMLRAIEDEHFEQLPGGIFNKGFVRAYARQLGLDENETVASYLAAVDALQSPQPAAISPVVEEIPAAEGPQQTHKISIPWFKLAVAMLVLAIGVAVWGFRSRAGQNSQSPPENQSGTEVAPATHSVTPVSRKPAAESENRKPERTVAASDSQPAVAISRREEIASPETVSAPVVNAASTVTIPGGFQVRIVANEDSWMRITADGQEVMQDVLSAQGVKAVAARKELVIKAGNVGGLDFWFNGKRLAAQGDLDQVKTLTFDQSGLVASSAHPQTTNAQMPSVR